MEEQRQAHRLGVCHRDLSHEVLGRSEHGREVGQGVVVPLGFAVAGQEPIEMVLRAPRTAPPCPRPPPALAAAVPPCQPTTMAILVDEPLWWWRGRRWCHLVSDVSLAELHEFAATIGIPTRSFQGDHYDIQDRRDEVLAAGGRGAEPRAARPSTGCGPAAVPGAAAPCA